MNIKLFAFHSRVKRAGLQRCLRTPYLQLVAEERADSYLIVAPTRRLAARLLSRTVFDLPVFWLNSRTGIVTKASTVTDFLVQSAQFARWRAATC